MAKYVQSGEDIHIAPGITGKRDYSGELCIVVDSTEKQLFPEDNIEDKIKIFESQVNGWFLEKASDLLGEEDNGFVIIMIATSYIEEIEQYRRGKSSNNQSGAFFKEGVKRIFGIDSDSQLNNLHKELRCELFHNGMTGPYIRIDSRYPKDIDFLDNNIIKINQRQFLEKVKEDFGQYLADLKNESRTQLRNNFSKMYKF
jgi:hypothetical protein